MAFYRRDPRSCLHIPSTLYAVVSREPLIINVVESHVPRGSESFPSQPQNDPRTIKLGSECIENGRVSIVSIKSLNVRSLLFSHSSPKFTNRSYIWVFLFQSDGVLEDLVVSDYQISDLDEHVIS